MDRLEELPVDEVLLKQLTAMGFSEYRARKALLLNRMDVQLAMDWLLNNAESPTVDAPLTYAELQQIALQFQRAQQLCKFNSIFLLLIFVDTKPDPRVLEAVKQNICTFSVTGPKFSYQKWYSCFTCNLSGNKGCCETCANICHKGHALSGPRSSSFFCDCGAGEGKHPCKSLKPMVSSQSGSTSTSNVTQS